MKETQQLPDQESLISELAKQEALIELLDNLLYGKITLLEYEEAKGELESLSDRKPEVGPESRDGSCDSKEPPESS